MFRFPLWLGLWGTVLPVVVLIEGVLPWVFLVPAAITSRDWDQLFEFWSISARYGAAVGVTLGLVAMAFVVLRHGRSGAGSGRRVGANLGWCLGLASFIVLLNDALFFVFVKAFGWTAALRSGPSFAISLFPLALSVLMHCVALAWATARTITADDVLTPRVLFFLLRRSARMEG